MGFLRVVEVIPPLFEAGGGRQSRIQPALAMKKFVSSVEEVRDHADIFLLANVKDPAVIRFDVTHAAVVLQKELGVRASPVLVARDQNRGQLLSSATTMMSQGVGGLMLAWGDDLPLSARSSNVRDFPDLATAIGEVSRVRRRTGSRTTLFAPVDLGRLPRPGGAEAAKKRLRAGADLLLAQPPTTDAQETFDKHAEIIERAGLRGKVLLNSFPFTGEDDILRYEKAFGWKLPPALYAAARGGAGPLIHEAGEVVRRLRREGFPGVYVTTRGDPKVASVLVP